jgi:hypothetical protein
MKKVIVTLSMLLVISATYISCRKLDPSPPLISITKQFIEDARSEFYKTSNILASSNGGKKALEKVIIWERARTQNSSVGKVIIVPLHYARKEFIKTKTSTLPSIPLDELSVLYIYKTKQGQFKYEVVTRIPDEEYINGTNYEFSGFIRVEDWAGNLISAYKMKDGHKYKYKLKQKPQSAESGTNKNVNALAWIETCEYTDIWGLNSVTGQWEYHQSIYHGCYYEYIDLGDEPSSGPPEGYPSGGSTGGGPAPEEYTTYHFDDDNPTDGRVKFKLCGDYTWTKIGTRGLYVNLVLSGFTLIPDNPSPSNPPLGYSIGSMCFQISTASGLSAKQASEFLNEIWNYAVEEAVDRINIGRLAPGQFDVVNRIRKTMKLKLYEEMGGSASIIFGENCPGVPGSLPRYCD